MIDKLPPSCVEAEEVILGGILLDPDAVARVCDRLVAEAFYLESHRDIYRAALNLHNQNKPTDLLTITNWLSDRDILKRIGGRSKLLSLLDQTVSAVNIDALAELVMEKYQRRNLISAGSEIVELGYQTDAELPAIIDRSQQRLYQVSNRVFSTNTEHNSKINAIAYNALFENIPIYPTGFDELDCLMTGFEPGTLTLVAGRPSMGKSFIALNLAWQMMALHELPVAIFSLEMTKPQLEYRLWSLISVAPQYRDCLLKPLKGDRIRRHRAGLFPLEEWELKNISKISEIANNQPLYINDDRGITAAGIASECRQILAREGKLGLVVVDYLQMMAEDTGGNRSYELGDVARSLYKMAGDLEVPVVALSQISRGVENRQDKRPMMSDLSQSGILEMVADNIILAYRDEYYNPDTLDTGVLELILKKARHGETGTATVLFDRAYGILQNRYADPR